MHPLLPALVGGVVGGGGVGGAGGGVQAFAEKLHARGFPYVSILEGGMEALVEHLHQSER